MSTFRALRFARPGFLFESDRPTLLAYLGTHGAFFAGRGLDLQSLSDADSSADFEPLVNILMTPGKDTPAELIDSLFIIHELSGAPCEDDILELFHQKSNDPTEELTTTDLLMRLWLIDREALRELHLQQSTLRPRSFVYFTTEGDHPPPTPPDAVKLEGLRTTLDALFQKDGCGSGTVVHAYIHEDEWWFLVRHGERIRKVRGRSTDGREATFCFHPEKLDVVIYDLMTGELRVNAKTKKHRRIYQENFGFHLFGSYDYFPGTDKYTLDPILKHGPLCLRAEDIEGIDRIRLTAVKWVDEAIVPSIVMSAASDNLFSALLANSTFFTGRKRLLSATFRVYFSERDKQGRSLTIRQPNVVQFTRDQDSSLIEQWMQNRGFITAHDHGQYKQHAFCMA